jgi:hypothetical protein
LPSRSSAAQIAGASGEQRAARGAEHPRGAAGHRDQRRQVVELAVADVRLRVVAVAAAAPVEVVDRELGGERRLVVPVGRSAADQHDGGTGAALVVGDAGAVGGGYVFHGRSFRTGCQGSNVTAGECR